MKRLKKTLAMLLALCLVFTLIPATVLADGTTAEEPFAQGTAGSNSFRIPSLVTLSDGTLVAAADARWNTTYDGGGLDTIVSTSSDNGSTWSYSFANYLGDNGDEYDGDGSTAFIDPAMAVTSDDTIYMLVDLYPYGVALNGSGHTAPVTTKGFNDDGYLLLSGDNHDSYSYYLKEGLIYDSSNNAVDGYTVDGKFNLYYNGTQTSNLFYKDSPYKVVRTGFLYLTKSTDKGATWSDPELLDLKTTSEMVCLVAPGRGLVTEDGTIIFPVYSYHGDNDPSGNTQRMSFIYSEDNGKTWKRSDELNYNWASESAVIELNDGTLRFFFRNGTTNLCYVDYNMTSSSWGTPVNTGVDINSNCQMSAITYSKTINGKQVILVSCPTGPSEAGSNLSSAANRLNGKIFAFTIDSNGAMIKMGSISVTSDDAQFMYSCMTELNNGKIGILYEDCENAWGTGSNCYYTMSYDEYDLTTDMGLTFDTTKADETTGVEITAPGLQTINVTAGEATVKGGTITKTYDITLNDGAYTDSAVVKFPYDKAFDECYEIAGYVENEDGTITAFDVEVEDGYFVATVPHFSTVTITGNTGTIELVVGESVTITDDTGNYEGNASNESPYSAVATMKVEGIASTPTKGTNVETNAEVDLSDCLFTFTVKNDDYYTIESAKNEGYYLNNIATNNVNVPITTVESTVQVVTGTFDNMFQFKSQQVDGYSYNGTPTLHFHTEEETPYWNRCGTDTSIKCHEYIYRPAVEGETASSEIPGYVMVTKIADITSGEDYLIAQTNGTNYYVLYPGTTKDGCVVKINPSTYTTASTEITFTGVAPGETTAKVGDVTYTIIVYKEVEIAINYQADGVTVATDTITVRSDATTATLPVTVTANGNVYSVDTTTLTLSDETTYNVAVTKLEGTPITLPQGNTQTISVTLEDGQYVEWSTEDSSYVGVAGVYSASNLAYTNEAVLKGVQITDSAVTVLGTVHDANGNAVATYTWIVTVTDANGVTPVYRYVDVDQIENCTLYYSINGGNLVQVNGSGVSIIPGTNEPITVVDGEWYADLSLIFFAAPDEGYALTHMFVEDSASQYYVLSDGDGDVTDSSAWPLKDGVDADAVYTADGHTYSLNEIAALYLLDSTTIYENVKNSSDIWKSLDTNNDGKIGSTEYHGIRWALLEGYMNIDRLEELYKEALALGCTGITTITKGYSNNTKPGCEEDPISICVIAQQLPYIQKSITSITKGDGTSITDLTNASIEIGDTLTYTLDIVVPATSETVKYWDGYTWSDTDSSYNKNSDSYINTGASATISYSGITVKDSLYENLEWSTTTATSDTSNDTHLKATYDITLASSNWLQYVTDGKIINTASLAYDYVAGYGTGSYGGTSSAAAEAYVVLPEYVIDFGATITIDLKNDPLVKGYDTLKSAEAMYGDVTFNEGELTLTYTPNQILPGMDFIKLTVESEETDSSEYAYAEYGVRIYPATSVYYEEGYLSYTNDNKQWSYMKDSSEISNPFKNPGIQTSEKLSPPTYASDGSISGYTSGKVNTYGYDPLYDASTSGSMNSYAVSNTTGAYTTFTFTGTGFQLYGNSDSSSGYVTVYSKGNLSKLYMINTVLSGSTDVNDTTNDQQDDADADKTYYGLPFISETDLPYGTYTVQIKQTKGDAPIYLDGVRILNTLSEEGSSVFGIDLEDNPEFYELRDYVLNAIGVEDLTDSVYTDSTDRVGLADSVSEMAGQVYNALGDDTKAVIIDEGTTFDSDDAQDLLDNGPKNELYLYPGQTLVFKVTTNRVMQLGMKAPTGSANFTLDVAAVDASNNKVEDESTNLTSGNITLKTSVDMFYQIANNIPDTTADDGTVTENKYTYTVSISVDKDADGPLSVTLLKICDDPNATFTSLTEADIENVLLNVYDLVEEPASVYADATLDIAVNDADGNALATTQLVANGIEGEVATFTAADIQTAVEVLELPENYKLNDVTYSDTTVVYGAEGRVAFIAEKELTTEEKVEEAVKEIFNKISSFFKKWFRW